MNNSIKERIKVLEAEEKEYYEQIGKLDYEKQVYYNKIDLIEKELFDLRTFGHKL